MVRSRVPFDDGPALGRRGGTTRRGLATQRYWGKTYPTNASCLCIPKVQSNSTLIEKGNFVAEWHQLTGDCGMQLYVATTVQVEKRRWASMNPSITLWRRSMPIMKKIDIGSQFRIEK
jgi:hypothetical protein